jgi:glycosyltransferase involved in cell wall biosynthesis
LIEKTGGGLLVEADDLDDLGAGILRLYEDSALAERLGQSGYEGVREHYSVARMADRALEVYKNVAGITVKELAADARG